VKKIILEISSCETIEVSEENYKRLKEENLSGQLNILEEFSIDTTFVQHVDLCSEYNKKSK
jgi:hypothetical protein